MYDELMNILSSKSINIIKAVDISMLTASENRGYKNAIIIGITLSPEYIYQQLKNNITDYSEFGEKEHYADETAEWISLFLYSKGFRAFAQSERNLMNGCFDTNTKTSLLPHKKIAVMAGLGWIGKNNLLITEDYGCALCISTVLTDAPFPTENKTIIKPKCGDCNICKENCPSSVIHGTTWEQDMNRDLIIDVYHCDGCLKCLTNCIWTIKYVRKHVNINE